MQMTRGGKKLGDFKERKEIKRPVWRSANSKRELSSSWPTETSDTLHSNQCLNYKGSTNIRNYSILETNTQKKEKMLTGTNPV